MIIYEYILLSNIYIYIYKLCDIVATHTYDGHTGFTFIWSFTAVFTSRDGLLHNCEHDPSY